MIILEEQKEFLAEDLKTDELNRLMLRFRDLHSEKLKEFNSLKEFIEANKMDKFLKINLFIDDDMNVTIHENYGNKNIPLGTLNFNPSNSRVSKSFENFMNFEINNDELFEEILESVVKKFNNKKRRLNEKFISNQKIVSLLNSNMFQLEEIGAHNISKFFNENFFPKKYEKEIYEFLSVKDLVNGMYNHTNSYYYHNIKNVKELTYYSQEDVLIEYVRDTRFLDSIIHFYKNNWRVLHDIFKYSYKNLNIELAKKFNELKEYDVHIYNALYDLIMERNKDGYKNDFLWYL